MLPFTRQCSIPQSKLTAASKQHWRANSSDRPEVSREIQYSDNQRQAEGLTLCNWWAHILIRIGEEALNEITTQKMPELGRSCASLHARLYRRPVGPFFIKCNYYIFQYMYFWLDFPSYRCDSTLQFAVPRGWLSILMKFFGLFWIINLFVCFVNGIEAFIKLIGHNERVRLNCKLRCFLLWNGLIIRQSDWRIWNRTSVSHWMAFLSQCSNSLDMRLVVCKGHWKWMKVMWMWRTNVVHRMNNFIVEIECFSFLICILR